MSKSKHYHADDSPQSDSLLKETQPYSLGKRGPGVLALMETELGRDTLEMVARHSLSSRWCFLLKLLENRECTGSLFGYLT